MSALVLLGLDAAFAGWCFGTYTSGGSGWILAAAILWALGAVFHGAEEAKR